MNTQTQEIQGIAVNYFSKIQTLIKQMKASGSPLLDLGAGSPDIAPDRWVRNVFKANLDKPGAFEYGQYGGSQVLRTAVSKWYLRNYAVAINPDEQVLPLSGSKSGMNYISLAYLQAGDAVLVPNPGYATYANAARMAGASVQYYDLLEENNWYPDLEKLEALVDDSCKMIWINYPNMPTGQSSNGGVFKQILSFARRHNLLVCHDNPYSHISNDDPESILQYSQVDDRVLELNSLSKSHNLAGVRIAMMLGDSSILSLIRHVQNQFESGIFKPLQEAAAFALELNEAWYVRQNRVYAKRREIVYRILDVLGCYYNRNSVGMFVWAKIPPSFSDGQELSDYLLAKIGVLVVPGSVFGSNGKNHIRVALTANEEQLEELLKRLLETKKNNHPTNRTS